MINWRDLIDEKDKALDETIRVPSDDWRKEAAYSLCELYYVQCRTQRGYGKSQRIDLRPGSDFKRFIDSHLSPLEEHKVWDALFPNKESATSATGIDEALQLLADSGLVDRVYSGDIITVNKIVGNIRKKRAKFLDTF